MRFDESAISEHATKFNFTDSQGKYLVSRFDLFAIKSCESTLYMAIANNEGKAGREAEEEEEE